MTVDGLAIFTRPPTYPVSSEFSRIFDGSSPSDNVIECLHTVSAVNRIPLLMLNASLSTWRHRDVGGRYMVVIFLQDIPRFYYIMQSQD